jgi:hypothetical protein
MRLKWCHLCYSKIKSTTFSRTKHKRGYAPNPVKGRDKSRAPRKPLDRVSPLRWL